MQLTNTRDQYGVVTKALYWMIFLLIAAEFVLGFGVMGAEEGAEVFGRPRSSIFNIHATLGITVFLLAAIRLWWRRSRPLPEWSPQLNEKERTNSHRLEWTLYAMMFAKPITGLLLVGASGIDVAFLGVLDLPSFAPKNSALRDIMLTLHIVTGVILLIAFALHLALGIRHHLRNNNRHLNRMLPFTRQ